MSEELVHTLKKDEGLLKRATHIKTQRGARERNMTIGYGYNLSAHHNPRQDLIESGVPEDVVDDVLKGRAEINEDQATSLLTIAAVRAKRDAMRVVANFNQLPEPVQNVVVNLSYQLGPTKLKGFKQFREALYVGDYGKAADEVLNSDMARYDSSNRSNRHAKALRKVAEDMRRQVAMEPSIEEKREAVKKEILYQRALKLKKESPDPLVPKVTDIFLRMRRPDEDAAGPINLAQENNPNGTP